jgi:hypothetical protein
MVAIHKKAIDHGVSAYTGETLNKLDLVSIEALISYVAYRQGVEEMFLRRAVLLHFKIDDLKMLPRIARDTAIRFIVDYKVVANSR